ncbi:Flp family type IVb pilin [Photobacterium sp.]|uniref:Flp family type IVb pilin n=1 Tax=Photobacterium sp. TaxID=660 RepID=UPI00299D2A6A|nr:Flp family type IVb pilin [Photobacterium sp.]MDX1302212.1 Flp family type IVb pilin [Photobacterium sp.]
MNLTDFCTDEEGLTTVEYAIAGSSVTFSLLLAFTSLGAVVKNSIVRLANLIP